MATVRIEVPPKLIPVFSGEADIRGSWGGRGSGKTRTFAKMSAVRAYKWDMEKREGIILCGRQFMNSLDESSLEEVKAAIRSEPWLEAHFDIGEKYIRTKSGRVAYKFAGLDRHIDSIKSKARILLCWVDEAEPVSEDAWRTLIPTLREEDSELWVTWNPKRRGSATDLRFKQASDPRMKIVEMNWRDNPWFPDILDRVRLKDLRERPDQYEHVWEGDYAKTQVGSYFARQIAEMKQQGRLGKVAPDPLMTLRAFWDIGGTGAKADACAIWIAQFVGREIRVLDYYEAKGQPLATHVQWLRDNGYSKALCVLPHDGVKHDQVYSVTYESALTDAGFSTEVIPNQGTGAAAMRIEAVRRLFPVVWMNEAKTEAGLFALGAYHAKRDDARGIDLGPNHDWSSHACLVAGSLVSTDRGSVPIEAVKIGDKVATPVGFANVQWSGLVKIADEIVCVRFDDGTEIKMTGEHKVFSTTGLSIADALSYNDEVVAERNASSWKLDRAKLIGYRAAFIESFAETNSGYGKGVEYTHPSVTESCGFSIARRSGKALKRLSRLMGIGKTSTAQTGLRGARAQSETCHSSMSGKSLAASGITSGKAMGISQRATWTNNSCTEPFGRQRMVQFLMGGTSIMTMATSPTIELKTLWPCQQATTQRITQKQAVGSAATETESKLLRLASWLKLGTLPTRAGLGIKRMLRKLGSLECGTRSGANSAPENTKRRGQTGQNTAPRVVSVSRIRGKFPVYDLTVEHDHCYFANGILVSNSDAFGLMCITYEAPKAINTGPKDYRSKPEARQGTSWMVA